MNGWSKEGECREASEDQPLNEYWVLRQVSDR